jgi:IS1 family transposase
MRSLVGKRKESNRWIWYAYYVDTRKILAFKIGKQFDTTCQKLFKKLSHLTINHFYMDDLRSYKKHTISKAKTQKIE